MDSFIILFIHVKLFHWLFKFQRAIEPDNMIIIFAQHDMDCVCSFIDWMLNLYAKLAFGLVDILLWLITAMRFSLKKLIFLDLASCARIRSAGVSERKYLDCYLLMNIHEDNLTNHRLVTVPWQHRSLLIGPIYSNTRELLLVVT